MREITAGIVARKITNGIAIEIAKVMCLHVSSAIEFAARARNLAGEDRQLLQLLAEAILEGKE